MTDTVLFSHLPTACGRTIGRATLNAPKALNALSLDMIRALDEQVARWQADPKVIAIWLEGAGEKGFCAGGDIVQMYKSMVKYAGEERNPFTEEYFAEEYRLDYRLHVSRTPVVAYGDGIVMGGGMGLLQGADFRLVTPRSRLAMPEITIGLFPDVGASWFLGRLAGKLGLFLGLTGVHLNARDTLDAGLADRLVDAPAETLLEQLAARHYSDNESDNRRSLFRFFQGEGRYPQEQDNALVQHLPLIERLCDGDSVSSVVEQLLAVEEPSRWLEKALGNLAKGCPQTAHLVWQQLQRGKYRSLAEIFRMEWCMAVQCSLHGDLQEGVRALLIDKDGKPAFRHAGVDEVSADYIDAFFQSPAPANPLQELEKG